MAPCTWRATRAACAAASAAATLACDTSVARHRERRTVDDRAGELEAHGDVGEHVLHRLERADRPAELLALRRVADGEVDELLGHAEELRCGGERAAVERGR